jgi:hypothetical protein
VNKVNNKDIEQAVKRVMGNILCGKSVLYTKTDLTQICNRSGIRLEAVQRLIAADLLVYGNNFWLEPSRTRKDVKKDSKRLLREGWMK